MDNPPSSGAGGADVVEDGLNEVGERSEGGIVVGDIMVSDVLVEMSVAWKFIWMRGAQTLNEVKLVVERASVVLSMS